MLGIQGRGRRMIRGVWGQRGRRRRKWRMSGLGSQGESGGEKGIEEDELVEKAREEWGSG